MIENPALLAILAIFVRHFYWTIFDPDVYPMSWAWLTGFRKRNARGIRMKKMLKELNKITSSSLRDDVPSEIKAISKLVDYFVAATPLLAMMVLIGALNFFREQREYRMR